MQDNLSVFLLILRFGLAITLYAFLAISIYILWKDLNSKFNSAKISRIPQIILSYRNQEYTYEQPEISIGRDPNCNLQLNNETVSSNHARIFFEFNQWWLEDTNSSNGTRLNSMPLSTPAVLTNEDQIEFGNANILVILKKTNP